MSRALVFGGTGQIGIAVSKALLDAGWHVDVVTRGRRSLEEGLLDAGAHRLSGEGRTRHDVIAESPAVYDAVFDPTCYTARDAEDLLASRERVGAYCVVSSAGVYMDHQGRTLDKARETGFPDFHGLIDETNPTVSPGPASYATRKIAMEQAMLSGHVPVTILRPCAIYGFKARHPREWWFVKRALDGRTRVPICFEGRSVFHTSSSIGIASLTRLCLERRETAILNIADPNPLSVAEISVAIGRAVNTAFELKSFAGPPKPPAFVGRSPWSCEHPIALSTHRARSLGWDGGPAYADAVAPYCQWLVDTARKGDWLDHFAGFHQYAFDPFDYRAEDEFLARH